MYVSVCVWGKKIIAKESRTPSISMLSNAQDEWCPIVSEIIKWIWNKQLCPM